MSIGRGHQKRERCGRSGWGVSGGRDSQNPDRGRRATNVHVAIWKCTVHTTCAACPHCRLQPGKVRGWRARHPQPLRPPHQGAALPPHERWDGAGDYEFVHTPSPPRLPPLLVERTYDEREDASSVYVIFSTPPCPPTSSQPPRPPRSPPPPPPPPQGQLPVPTGAPTDSAHSRPMDADAVWPGGRR